MFPPDYDERQRRRCRRHCLVVAAVVISISGVCVLAAVLTRRNLKADPKMPEYSILDAVLWPNATVRDKVLVTADFTFTLRAHNINKKETIFYAANSAAQVSITTVYVNHVIASLSPALVGPTSLPPGNYSDVIAVNISARNASFSFPGDEGDTKDLYLRMRFRVGFKEGSKYDTNVKVSCFYLRCAFPKCSLADPKRCHSDSV